MERKSDLSPRKRGQIKVLLENIELTQCQIGLKCGVAQSVVSSMKKTCNMVQLALHNVKEDFEESRYLDNKLIKL